MDCGAEQAEASRRVGIAGSAFPRARGTSGRMPLSSSRAMEDLLTLGRYRDIAILSIAQILRQFSALQAGNVVSSPQCHQVST